MEWNRALTILRLAGIVVAMALSGAAALGLDRAPAPGAPVLVVAPPWGGGAAEVVRRAGGREISPARAPFAVLAVLDGADAARAMRSAGAWFVLDAARVARLCDAQTRNI